MNKSEMEFFIEEMSSIGDEWTLEQVEECYGDSTLEDALENRRSLVNMHLGNIAAYINSVLS